MKVFLRQNVSCKIYISALLILNIFQLSAQTTVFNKKYTLDWFDTQMTSNNGDIYKQWSFIDAIPLETNPELPLISEKFPVPSKGRLSIQIDNPVYEPFNDFPIDEEYLLTSSIKKEADILANRNQFFGSLTILPIKKTASGSFERLVSCRIKVLYTPEAIHKTPVTHSTQSVLSNGSIYKIAIQEDGVYKLDYNFLKDQLGIDLANTNPNHIKIYGNSGGMLPELIDTSRPDDLIENAIQIIGGADNSFDSEDYILFYGEGPNRWYYSPQNTLFNWQQNAYDTKNYYFIKIDSDNSLRINTAPAIANTAYTTNEFDDYQIHDEDRVNLLGSLAFGAVGTGKIWYGDKFNPTRSIDYPFSFPNAIAGSEANISMAMAARHSNSSSYKVSIGNQTFQSGVIYSVDLTDSEKPFATRKKISKSFTLNNDQVNVNVNYPSLGNGTNEAWLDFIQINAKRALNMVGDQMKFRNIETMNHPSASFNFSNLSENYTIWDISNPQIPVTQTINRNGNQSSFGVNISDTIITPNEFIAFNTASGLLTPEAIGAINNQNLHNISSADMLVIYHPDFEGAVRKFTSHRSNHDNLNIVTVTVNDIYNEFSSGRQDPTAIRDFVRMVYTRDDNLQYLLLFGDGSYDYRNISKESDNFVPIYTTDEHLDPIYGFPADDYFALVTDDDGRSNFAGDIDIAVGRIPTKSNSQAEKVVDKIIFYDSNPERLRDWRNQVLFVGDDGDSNIHTKQANRIADSTILYYPDLNVDKVLFDAFVRQTTAGGSRYPAANESLNRSAFKGTLVTNYLGHGGATGWAQERVLQTEDIQSWKNFKRLPLVVTATCSFAAYDDHKIVPAGEIALLKPDGGAIALFTTVRAVVSSSNFTLTKSVFNEIFKPDNNQEYLAMGEILRVSKNAVSGTSNKRKFTMLGDPSQYLALPKYNIATKSINGRLIDTSSINTRLDTLRALDKVVVTGYIYDNNGNIKTDFNGYVYPTIYDKELPLQTLGQAGNDVFNYKLRKNALFRGKASVINGEFTFEFILPKDIDYNYGTGKISYYAENGLTDASGYYEKIVIGGSNPNAEADDIGPTVNVFMNTEDFVSGGLTDKNPSILAKISDDFGINTGGVSIGHDLTATLDNNQIYILNDFYNAGLNDYTKGSVEYPLYDLEEGLHQITVKAWDTSNNSGEGSTSFYVASDAKSALKQVLNYPNPFTTSTNFQFEHPFNEQELDILVQIFTVSGKLVKTIEHSTLAKGYRITDIHWDGKDQYGGQLAKGVYLYKIKVAATDGLSNQQNMESKFEKLVILK